MLLYSEELRREGPERGRSTDGRMLASCVTNLFHERNRANFLSLSLNLLPREEPSPMASCQEECLDPDWFGISVGISWGLSCCSPGLHGHALV